MDVTVFLYPSDRSNGWNSKVIPSTSTLPSKGLKYLMPVNQIAKRCALEFFSNVGASSFLLWSYCTSSSLTSFGGGIDMNFGCVDEQTEICKLSPKQIRLVRIYVQNVNLNHFKKNITYIYKLINKLHSGGIKLTVKYVDLQIILSSNFVLPTQRQNALAPFQIWGCFCKQS